MSPGGLEREDTQRKTRLAEKLRATRRQNNRGKNGGLGADIGGTRP